SPFRNRVAVLAMIAAPAFLAAQQGDDTARPVSLEEAVRLAQLNSPLTVGARNALRTGKLSELNALGQYLPSIGVGYSASNFSGGTFFQGEVVPYKGNPWNYGRGYNANLPLFDGGQGWFSYRQAQANQPVNGETEVL